ncbi:hypothetical protein [Neptunicoccus sediminis]|uniref:hypothetical protein n=1 Tax=Neptunicoccus sediminis TaxID=1892596 RepID=UPI0008460658|nr:hypothetical protein [Neptunicoccus sediminis]
MKNRYETCVRSVGAQIRNRARQWGQSEDGAVTVDWVVLTATMTVIGGVIVALTVDGTTDVGNQIGTVLSEKTVSE